MSSTNQQVINKKLEEKARQFFHEEILSNINYTRDRWFPLFPEPDKKSYFKNCQKTRMSPQDFELPQYTSIEELQIVLQNLWNEMGDHDIASCAKGLAQLAWELYKTQQKKEDISPYIYVMF